MKTLIFSDSHLSLPFEEKKFNFIEGIIKPVDKVIINGDFWESSLMSFQNFVNSPWRNLFPLLKEKKTIYIYGNHDKKISTNSKVNLFSDQQTDRYILNLKDKELVIEHGNRIHPFIDDRMNWSKINSNITKPYEHIERLMVRKLGTRFLKMCYGRMNKKMKKKLKDELKLNQIYICGHTHYAEIDKESQFINSGLVRHGLGQYLVIEQDRIVAKEEWYD